MAAEVGRLDMENDQVVGLEGLQRRVRLRDHVRIEPARGPRDVDWVDSDGAEHPADQRDAGNARRGEMHSLRDGDETRVDSRPARRSVIRGSSATDAKFPRKATSPGCRSMPTPAASNGPRPV